MKKLIIFVFISALSFVSEAQKCNNVVAPQINFANLMQDHWSEQEQKNVNILADFVQQLMNNHNFEYIIETYGNSEYVQHNKSIPDGITGLVNFIRDNFAKRFPEYSYDVKWIAADGDKVVFHSHVTTKAAHRGNEKKGFIITDTWRLKDGRIFEHWDAIQGINGSLRFYFWIAGGKNRNTNNQF